MQLIQTSALYKEKINAPVRASKPMAIFDFVNQWEYPFASALATTSAVGYNANQLVNGRLRLTDYGLDGVDIADELKLPQKGWKGTVLSDSAGILPSAEVLTATYVEEALVQNFYVIATRGNRPVDFTIEYMSNGVWEVLVVVSANADAFYRIQHTHKVRVTKVRLTITKISSINDSAHLIQFGAVTTVVFGDSDIVDLDLLEEKESISGSVTSNNASVTLNNDEKFYTATNVKSPFYSLLKKDMRFRTFIAVETTEDLYEAIPLGTFYASDWSGPTSGLEVNFGGLDRLQAIWDKPVPMIRALKSTSLYHLFKKLLESLGLVEDVDFVIDTSINAPLDWGWVPADKMGEALTALSLATNTTVSCDRYDVIQIGNSLDFTQPVAAEWKDSDQIISINNPLKFSETYSEMDIKVYKVFPSDQEDSILNHELTIDPGTTVFLGPLEFSTSPVLQVKYVKVVNGTNVDISSFSYGATTIELEVVNNSSTKQKVTLEAVGITLQNTSYTHHASAQNNQYNISGRAPEIDSPLIQREVLAKEYAANVLRIKADPLSNVSIEARGDPSITLSDILMVDDPTDMLPPMKVIPIRQKIVWSSGLSVEMDAIREVATSNKVTGFLGMGMGLRKN